MKKKDLIIAGTMVLAGIAITAFEKITRKRSEKETEEMMEKTKKEFIETDKTLKMMDEMAEALEESTKYFERQIEETNKKLLKRES